MLTLQEWYIIAMCYILIWSYLFQLMDNVFFLIYILWCYKLKIKELVKTKNFKLG